MPSQKDNPAFVAMYKQEFGLHVVWQKVSLEELAEHENYFHGRCPDSMLAKGVKNFLDCLCESDQESARRDAVLKFGGHVARALFVSSMPETVRVACFEYMLRSRMCFKLRNNGNGFYVKALKDWLYSQTFHKYVERWIAFGTTFKVPSQSGSRKGQKRGRASKGGSTPTSATSPAASPSSGVMANGTGNAANGNGMSGTAAAGNGPLVSVNGSNGALPSSASTVSAFHPAMGLAAMNGNSFQGLEESSRSGGSRSARGSRGRGGSLPGTSGKTRKRQDPGMDAAGAHGVNGSGFSSVKIPVFGGSDNEDDQNEVDDDHERDPAHSTEEAGLEAEAETELIDSEDMGDDDAHVPLKVQLRQLKRRLVVQESTLQVLQSRFGLLERVNMQQQAIINQLVSQAVMQAKAQAEMQFHSQEQQANGRNADLLAKQLQLHHQQQLHQQQQQQQQQTASVKPEETNSSLTASGASGSPPPTSTMSTSPSPSPQPSAIASSEAMSIAQ